MQTDDYILWGILIVILVLAIVLTIMKKRNGTL